MADDKSEKKVVELTDSAKRLARELGSVGLVLRRVASLTAALTLAGSCITS